MYNVRIATDLLYKFVDYQVILVNKLICSKKLSAMTFNLLPMWQCHNPRNVEDYGY